MNEEYPDTIHNPETFQQSNPPGFDGVFDWSWVTAGLKRILPDTKMTPMDIDALVEKGGQFLYFETKNVGVDVQQGQQITLRKLAAERNKTGMVVWGKTRPEYMAYWRDEDESHDIPLDVTKAEYYVAAWCHYACQRTTPPFQCLIEKAEQLFAADNPPAPPVRKIAPPPPPDDEVDWDNVLRHERDEPETESFLSEMLTLFGGEVVPTKKNSLPY